MRVVAELGLPLIVKPAREGSTIGITKVDDGRSRRAARSPTRRRASTTTWCSSRSSSTAGADRVDPRRPRAAADPHRGAAGQLRLPQQVLLRRDASTSARAACRREGRARSRRSRSRRSTSSAARGWGRLDLILRRRRLVPVPRGEHVARHDRPQPGADGGAAGRHRRSPTSASRSCEARMWDDPRQLNALARRLSLRRRSRCSPGARVAWLVRQPAFAFREVVVTAPLRARERGASRGGRARRARAARSSRWISTASARGARARAVGAQRRAAPAVAATARGRRSRSTCRSRAGTTPRWSTPTARCSSPTTTASCRSSTGPTARAAEVAARYRELGAALAPLGLAMQRDARCRRAAAGSCVAAGRRGPLTIELGRDDPGARLARFVAAYGRTIGALARGGTRIDHVDLRYRNGFAARVPGFQRTAARRSVDMRATGQRW